MTGAKKKWLSLAEEQFIQWMEERPEELLHVKHVMEALSLEKLSVEQLKSVAFLTERARKVGLG